MQLIAPIKVAPVKPIYLVHGGEIWQSNDAINKIYANYRDNNLKKYYFTNFAEFEKFITEQKISTYNLDLFCDNKINTLIKIDINEAKFTKKQQEILLNLLKNLNNFVVVLVAAKIDKTAANSSWLRMINEVGVIIIARHLSINSTKRWVKEQLLQQHLSITDEALDFFITTHQNNLLAASQAIYKLSLINKHIDLDLLKTFILDQAEYSVFDLLHALISKNTKQIIYILHKLKNQQISNVLILWAIIKFIKQQQQYQLLPKVAEIDLAIKNTDAVASIKTVNNKSYIWSLFLDLCLSIY